LGVKLGSVVAEPMHYEGLCIMRGMHYEGFNCTNFHLDIFFPCFLSFKLGLAAQHCASLADALLENSDPTEQNRNSISCG
jgi:hypothetical protein